MGLREQVAGLPADRVVLGGIFAVANRLQRVLDEVLDGLTAKQWWLLVLLSLSDEPPTISELASTAETSHQNTRQLLDKLAAKGFVILRPDPEDGRVTRIEVTDTARAWESANQDGAQEFLAAVFAGASPRELAVTAQVLLTAHAAMDEIDGRTS